MKKSTRPYRVFMNGRAQPATISFETKEAMVAYLGKLKCDQIKAIYVYGQRQDALTTKAVWLAAQAEEQPNGKPVHLRQRKR